MYTVVLIIRQIYCLLQLDFTGSLVAGFIGLPLEYNLFFSCGGSTSDTCNGMKCPANQVCKLVKGKATCQCPNVRDCSYSPAPVCGSDGNEYPNECYLLVKSCLAALENKSLNLSHKGKCGKSLVSWKVKYLRYLCHIVFLASQVPNQNQWSSGSRYVIYWTFPTIVCFPALDPDWSVHCAV